MESTLKEITTHIMQRANRFGTYVNWALCAFVIINLLVITLIQGEHPSLAVHLLVSGEILVLLLANVFIYWRKADNAAIRFIMVGVLLLVAAAATIASPDYWWCYFIIPMVFSIQYIRPRFTLTTGILASLIGPVVCLLRVNTRAISNSDLRFLQLTDHVNLDLLPGPYGIAYPLSQTGKVDIHHIYTASITNTFGGVLLMLLITFIAVGACLAIKSLLKDVEKKQDGMSQEEKAHLQAEHTMLLSKLETLQDQLHEQQDITLTAIKASDEANQSKATFLNNMSHNIRTPMNAIMGYTELATSHLDNKEQLEGYLKKITSSCQNLIANINERLKEVETSNNYQHTSESLSDNATDTDTLIEGVGKHVLLAEDNELNQEIIVAQLEAAGFTVDVANDGLEAVAKVMNNPANTYNFILMDFMMPRMNGYEATKNIRAIPNSAKSQIPIIAISANAFEEDKRKAIEAGMNGHIAKPIDLPTLLKEISRILDA